MNVLKIKEESRKIFEFLKQKRVLIIITLILLGVIIGITASIRTNNISTLKDATTGEYLTADLDAFYWLRLATILDVNGSYPAYDIMRYPPLKIPFSNELLPSALVFLHKILGPLSDKMTLRYVDVIYPVVFYILGLIIFFFRLLQRALGVALFRNVKRRHAEYRSALFVDRFSDLSHRFRCFVRCVIFA